MATLPSANTTISAEASPLAGGTGYCVVFAAVARNADCKPRVYSSWKTIIDQHDYSAGADYSAHHIRDTRQPVLFVPIPIATAGVVGRIDASKVTGTSVISVTPGPNGILEETNGILIVDKGGTVETDDVRVRVSLDNGVTYRAVRLKGVTSYTFPYVGIVLNFAAGTLVEGDTYRFATTAPAWDADGIAAGRVELGKQQRLARSWMVIGDAPTDTVANAVISAVNDYETLKKRFTTARVGVRDRLPFAAMSRTQVRMKGNPTVTFAEVGASGDTITRSAGSFVADGFAVGMTITITGSASNNVTGIITAVSATVLTFGTTDLVDEGPVANVAIVGSHTLTFAEVGASGDTVTRSGGSWLDDGFRAGDTITILGTASNNVSGIVTAVTSTVLTFGTTDLAPESIASAGVQITAGETMAAWVAAMADEFAPIVNQKRINLGLGRLRKASRITTWELRRSVQWPTSIREYQHDIHRPTWAKDDKELDGWVNTDADGNVVEYDDAETGGALDAGFTCARTWSNDVGVFVAMDLTRAEEGTALQYMHNMNVANLCCATVQRQTEKMVGQTPPVGLTGRILPAAKEVLEEAVNTDLEQTLLREFVKGEGPRASYARWSASSDDILNVPDATFHGVGDLRVNGTIVHVDTLQKVS